MALKDLKLIQSGNLEISRLQDNIREFLIQLNRDLLSGIFLEKASGQVITVLTTTTLIPHSLGRKFIGWQILDIQGDARVWRDTSSTADPALYLPLKASSSVVVKLWVF